MSFYKGKYLIYSEYENYIIFRKNQNTGFQYQPIINGKKGKPSMEFPMLPPCQDAAIAIYGKSKLVAFLNDKGRIEKLF